jgi:hypothetical protein
VENSPRAKAHTLKAFKGCALASIWKHVHTLGRHWRIATRLSTQKIRAFKAGPDQALRVSLQNIQPTNGTLVPMRFRKRERVFFLLEMTAKAARCQ